MKKVLYMAITTNGIIAKSNDDTSWISEKEWDSYGSAVKKAGCLIIGRRTYEILTKQPEFAEFKDTKIVVVSRKNFSTLSQNHLVAHSPKKALELLKDYKEVIIAGGGILNASFFAKDLIDEVYLDIEPLILGKGIKIFADCNAEMKLKLLGTKKISSNEIQLHYKVIR